MGVIGGSTGDTHSLLLIQIEKPIGNAADESDGV